MKLIHPPRKTKILNDLTSLRTIIQYEYHKRNPIEKAYRNLCKMRAEVDRIAWEKVEKEWREAIDFEKTRDKDGQGPLEKRRKLDLDEPDDFYREVFVHYGLLRPSKDELEKPSSQASAASSLGATSEADSENRDAPLSETNDFVLDLVMGEYEYLGYWWMRDLEKREMKCDDIATM